MSGCPYHREYFKVYDKILEEGQKLGTKLDDKDVNLYALSFMSTRLKPNELLLSEKTEKERCKEFKLENMKQVSGLISQQVNVWLVIAL